MDKLNGWRTLILIAMILGASTLLFIRNIIPGIISMSDWTTFVTLLTGIYGAKSAVQSFATKDR